jgi:Transposase DDE domain group 1
VAPPNSGEGKNVLRWTRLFCHSFRHNTVRFQLYALAYNLTNFLRSLALPQEAEQWSLTTLREKLVKIGARTFTTSRSERPRRRLPMAGSTACVMFQP